LPTSVFAPNTCTARCRMDIVLYSASLCSFLSFFF
jgi:hypothetical protein